MTFGQSIWTNPITGTDPNLSNPYSTGDIMATNITVSGIGRGTGINGNSGANRYNANGWNTTDIDLTAYFEWTLTPNLGCEIDFTSFVYTSQRSNSSIANFAFRSSIDGFSSNIGTPDFDGTTIDLSGLDYQNITVSITFRFYAWGASSSANTFSINDFTFNGSTSCGTPSNTINTGILIDPSFSVDCTNSTTDSGTIDFTSTGTFDATNNYVVELSDATGNFTNPIQIGVSTNNTANSGTLNFTLPATLESGSSYSMRIVSTNPVVTGTDNGANVTITQTTPCVPSLPAQGLLINEFSNGASGSEEYYEFVVAGECGSLVDVRGYIIDDNNGTFSTTFPSTSGIAQGHLRLSQNSLWANIAVGSLIVVYNAADRNSFIPADDPFDSNNDSLYVIPHNNIDLFEITDDLPRNTSPSDSTYSPVIYDNNTWAPLGIANDGDAVQVRLPNGNYWHGVSYGGTTISGGPNDMKIFNGSMTNMCGWFNSGDIYSTGNWSVGNLTNQTPGLPNNSANLAWLRLMRDPNSLTCPITVLPSTTINFEAVYNNGSTYLSWQTQSEQNNDHFTILHSQNGYDFSPVGNVAGAGNSSSTIEYNIIHNRPAKGINYYKLTSTDYDGTRYNKGIVSVMVEGQGTYFDPQSSQLLFSEQGDYLIYSTDGKLLGTVENGNSLLFDKHGMILIQNVRTGESERLFVP